MTTTSVSHNKESVIHFLGEAGKDLLIMLNKATDEKQKAIINRINESIGFVIKDVKDNIK